MNEGFYKKNTRRFELAACGRETSAAKAPGVPTIKAPMRKNMGL
jgi:hypothetical protein